MELECTGSTFSSNARNVCLGKIRYCSKVAPPQATILLSCRCQLRRLAAKPAVFGIVQDPDAMRFELPQGIPDAAFGDGVELAVQFRSAGPPAREHRGHGGRAQPAEGFPDHIARIACSLNLDEHQIERLLVEVGRRVPRGTADPGRCAPWCLSTAPDLTAEGGSRR